MKRKAHDGDRDLACLCGRLIARWVNGAIELRCQRCKRTLRLEPHADGTITIAPVAATPL